MAKNIFNSIKLSAPKRNYFDLTHDVKLSLDMGDLVPIMALEAIPGDSFNISAESLLRFAPLIAPVMHRMNVTMHYFFVPNRILWDGWEKFITQDEGAGVHPYLPISGGEADNNYTKLCDYMGIPNPGSSLVVENVNAFPFAAYQCIYNEYYRDQNLVSEVNYKLDAGDNAGGQTQLQMMRKRAWMHDYFTASLPWAQKGPAVDIPLGDVRLKDDWYNANDQPVFRSVDGSYAADGDLKQATTGGGTNHFVTTDSVPANAKAYDPEGSLETEATTITDLRRAFKLQEWLERNARAGTRYVENILVKFGVKSPDARLQRPEYITGTKSPVVISEILNTTGEDAGLPQGNMAGHGISVTAGRAGNYYCQEHGWIMGIMSVMPVTAYQQGINKSFLKNDAFDYYEPLFAHIGEQLVQGREIFAFDSDEYGNGTFGYVPRYAEYKYMPSRVAGDFRNTLSYWHLGRIFDTPPALNQQFIECDPDKRIFAVESEENSLYAHVLNKVTAKRLMPKFGNPGF